MVGGIVSSRDEGLLHHMSFLPREYNDLLQMGFLNAIPGSGKRNLSIALTCRS